MAPQGHFTCPGDRFGGPAPRGDRPRGAVSRRCSRSSLLCAGVGAEQPRQRCCTATVVHRRSCSWRSSRISRTASRPRFHLVHVLSREAQDVELVSAAGLDPERLGPDLRPGAAGRVRRRVVPLRTVRDGHRRAGSVARARKPTLAHVHLELFHVGDEPPPPRSEEELAADAVAATVTVNLDGRTTRVDMPSPGRVDPGCHPAGPAGRAVRLHRRGVRHLPGAAGQGRGADGSQLRAGAGGAGPGAGPGLPVAPVTDEVELDYDA